MKKEIKSPNNDKTKHKFWFYIVLITIPFICLLLLEFILIQFNYGTSYKLFIPTPNEQSKFLGLNFDAPKKYFSNINDVPTPRKDLFLKEKPKNGYRIFVLGGSTAAGFPYGNNLTFSRILGKRLSDTYPNLFIEVINTGFTAINTYAQLDFIDDILEHEPDAILIYSGHNEYLGALGVGSMESLGKNRAIVKIILELKEFKSYQLLENIISSVFGPSSSNTNNKTENPNATMMERIVSNKSIEFDSEDYQLGIEQFEDNLEQIISEIKNANVEIILSELVSNLRDQKPFISKDTTDQNSALGFYNLGKSLEQKNQYKEAKEFYKKAKDFDALRFRAPEKFNDIINDLGKKHSISVVQMEHLFEQNSSIPIIGNDLMHEHLHPNLDGYFLMADAFYNNIITNKFISSELNAKDVRSSAHYKKNWGFTEVDSTYAEISINQLKGGWPFHLDGRKNSFIDKYEPKNLVDSAVINILRNKNSTLEQAHLSIAEKYEKQGEMELALKEYIALIYTVPYFEIFYEPAIKNLAFQNRYGDALTLLQQLGKYQDNLFTNKWTGQLYLALNQPKLGITYLEKALQLNPTDEILTYNLCRAYFNISEIAKGNALFKEFKNKFPNSRYIRFLESFSRGN